MICIMNAVKGKWWMVFYALIYARWMLRDYRELIKMIEAWLDERPVKDEANGSRLGKYILVSWTAIGAPWSIALMH